MLRGVGPISASGRGGYCNLQNENLHTRERTEGGGKAKSEKRKVKSEKRNLLSTYVLSVNSVIYLELVVLVEWHHTPRAQHMLVVQAASASVTRRANLSLWGAWPGERETLASSRLAYNC